MSAHPDALRAVYDALERRDWASARDEGATILARSPDSAAAHHAMALSFWGEGALARAADELEAAVRLEPDVVAWARDLGVVVATLGEWARAVRTLGPVVHRLDQRSQALFFSAAVQAGDAAHAIELYEAIAHEPVSLDAELLCEYGRALHAAGRPAEAGGILTVCSQRPDAPDRVHDHLASHYHLAGLGDRALAHARQFAQRQTGSAYAQLRLAGMLSLRGRLEESRQARLAAMSLGLARPADWTSALKMMLCDTHETGLTVKWASAERFRALGVSTAFSAGPRPPRRPGRTRIGYLSAEFDLAPARFFLNPFLLNHDRDEFEIFLYDTRQDHTASEPGVARLGEHLRHVGRTSDADLAALVAADDIDVLVDLMTHFPGNRLEALHRRMAPIQASLPNCPSTTGSDQVDFILTDRWTTPSGSEAEYTEHIHRLPSGYLVYSPPVDGPAVLPLPDNGGQITFGVIQQLMKIGPDVWDAIARILGATPGSRLLLHNSDHELPRVHSATNQFARDQLAAREIDPARMVCVGRLNHRDHLALVGTIDIALDTWPFTGTTTTCECLWMGVPVVTRTGSMHASRVSTGLLERAGLHELVAPTIDAYVAIASRLAADIQARRLYRETLRGRMERSGLTNGRALARAMEAAYTAWMTSAARL